MREFEEHVRRGPGRAASRSRPQEDPSLFGLFEEAPHLPVKATIFRRPAGLEREIRITVLHEVAHYFGLDEERLEQLGYR